eukprot:13127649-Alexandrium_andersonii.AAC.1
MAEEEGAGGDASGSDDFDMEDAPTPAPENRPKPPTRAFGGLRQSSAPASAAASSATSRAWGQGAASPSMARPRASA